MTMVLRRNASKERHGICLEIRGAPTPPVVPFFRRGAPRKQVLLRRPMEWSRAKRQPVKIPLAAGQYASIALNDFLPSRGGILRVGPR